MKICDVCFAEDGVETRAIHVAVCASDESPSSRNPFRVDLCRKCAEQLDTNIGIAAIRVYKQMRSPYMCIHEKIRRTREAQRANEPDDLKEPETAAEIEGGPGA